MRKYKKKGKKELRGKTETEKMRKRRRTEPKKS